jgi:hypothetical protein
MSVNWIRLYRRTECVNFVVSLALPIKEMLLGWRKLESAATRHILPAKQTPHYRCWRQDTVLLTAQEISLHVHLSTLPRTRDRVAIVTRIWEGKLAVWCPERARMSRLAPGHPKLLFSETMHSMYGVERPGLEAKSWLPPSVEAKCE